MTPAARLDALRALLGPDAVDADAAECRFMAQDMFWEGQPPLAIVRPATTAAVATLVRHAATAGLALHPRGGGMSYSHAFQPQRPQSLLIDFSRLAAIRNISAIDGHVTVEAGCTWAALDAALAPHGLRSRFWGPMSGAVATIGGSISQGAVTFGSGVAGASATAVKSFEIVTGTGEILHTGSDGSTGTGPFNRHYGPDLTGIFANDAGALGIKTAITLELEPRPASVGGISFAFDDLGAMLEALRCVTQHRLANEIFAMDAAVARQNSGPPDWRADAAALWRIGKAAGNPAMAATRMALIATGGRRFLSRALYTAHFTAEGHDARDLAGRIAAIRRIAVSGQEIVNTVPLMLRANPFPALPVTHPDGRRMLPIHGILPWSALSDFRRDHAALCADLAPALAAARVEINEFFTAVAGIGLLFEPVFNWPDTLSDYHRRMTPPAMPALPVHAANPRAGALVADATQQIIALMRRHGATHFQLGRLYPYAETREPAAGDLLRSLKRHLDPHDIINPGALGL